MRRRETEYNSQYIEFWPGQNGGKMVISFFSVLLAIIVIMALWNIFDGIIGPGTIFIPLGSIVAYCVIVRRLLYGMYNKVTVSERGIKYSNERTKREVEVLWDDVAVVYFYMDNWKGQHHFKIFLKGNVPNNLNKKCDYVLVPEAVDGKRLQSFIPSHLLVNDTIYDWDS